MPRKYEIRCVDYDSTLYDAALEEGFEPFAVTRETRAESGWDDGAQREYTDRSTVDVIWFRREKDRE